MRFPFQPPWRSRCLLILVASLWPAAATAILGDDDALMFMPESPLSGPTIVYVNQNYVVTCFAHENEDAVRLTWRNSFKEITERTGRVHVEESSSKKKGLDLFFEGITVREQGEYRCSAIIDGIEVTKSLNLLVYRKISFNNTPEVQYLTQGESQVVRCEATALPEAMLTWKINGRHPIRMKQTQRQDGLFVWNVTREDAGIYTCRATQSNDFISDFAEKNIIVSVKYKPEWLYPLMDTTYSYVGGIINLTCEAEGEPAPTYNWFQNENPIEPNEYIKLFEVDNKSVLQIRVQNETDFGDYSCLATNSEGTIDSTVQLLGGDKPAVPKFDVKNFDTSSITLDITGTSEGELEITGYTIQYRTDTQSWDDSRRKEVELKNGVNGGGDTSYILKNLEPSTAYHLRVAARNAVGLGDFTDEIIQMTREEAVPFAELERSRSWSLLGPSGLPALVASLALLSTLAL